MNETIQTINANLAHCIQQASYIGHTAFYNVCSGTHTDVPWGSLDWTLFIPGATAFVIVIGLLIVIPVAIYKVNQ